MNHPAFSRLPATLGLCILCALCAGIVSCETTDRYGLRADLAASPVVYVNEQVHREQPRITVRPINHPNRELSALFLPFRVRQAIDRPDFFGREMGRIFWNTWVGQSTLPVIQYADTARWPGGPAAAAAARALGADLVIGGDITHLYSGGTAGDTRVALTLEIWDAVSGQMLWSMEHGGMINRELTEDWIFAHRESRMPADPLHAVVQTLAYDLAQPVKSWQAAGLAPTGNATRPDTSDEDGKAPIREKSLF